MNNHMWINEKLVEQHQRQLRDLAEQNRVANLAQRQQPDSKPRQHLLTKLRAEMNELAERWAKTEVVPSQDLQRQS